MIRVAAKPWKIAIVFMVVEKESILKRIIKEMWNGRHVYPTTRRAKGRYRQVENSLMSIRDSRKEKCHNTADEMHTCNFFTFVQFVVEVILSRVN